MEYALSQCVATTLHSQQPSGAYLVEFTELAYFVSSSISAFHTFLQVDCLLRSHTFTLIPLTASAKIIYDCTTIPFPNLPRLPRPLLRPPGKAH